MFSVVPLNVTAILDIDPYCCDADTDTVNVPDATYTDEGQLDIVTVGGGRTTVVLVEVVAEVYTDPSVPFYVTLIE